MPILLKVVHCNYSLYNRIYYVKETDNTGPNTDLYMNLKVLKKLIQPIHIYSLVLNNCNLQ